MIRRYYLFGIQVWRVEYDAPVYEETPEPGECVTHSIGFSRVHDNLEVFDH